MFCPKCGKKLKIYSEGSCVSKDPFSNYYICKQCKFVYKETINYIKNFRYEVIIIHGISQGKNEKQDKSIDHLINALED